jgi:hypothetical protein
MNINEDKKIDILLSALDERYKSIHTIRARIQDVCLWTLGILLGASGWLIQSNIFFNEFQQAIYILGILIAFIALRFKYLEDLEKGFRSQQRVAARLEKTLGFFKPNEFNNSEEPIYPKDWENCGTEDGRGNFFSTTYTLLYIGIIFLIIAILSKGCILKISLF